MKYMDSNRSSDDFQRFDDPIEKGPKNNKYGLVGFILALLGLLFCWVPGLSAVLWLLGMIFSIIGICRPPRVFAAIGIGITCVSMWLILLTSSVYFLSRNTRTGYLSDYLFDDDNEQSRVEYVEVRGRKGYVHLYVGMPKDSVRQLVGRPSNVDLHTYGNRTHETWRYKINNSYIDNLRIEFVNGRLTSLDQSDY